MRRMSKPDIKQEAAKKFMLYISYFGLRNGKMIAWQVYKLFRDEEKRRKESGGKKK